MHISHLPLILSTVLIGSRRAVGQEIHEGGTPVTNEAGVSLYAPEGVTVTSDDGNFAGSGEINWLLFKDPQSALSVGVTAEIGGVTKHCTISVDSIPKANVHRTAQFILEEPWITPDQVSIASGMDGAGYLRTSCI